MRNIRSNVHQVGNAVAALPLGITLKEFANLKEQHDEDGLWELRLGTWQETDAKRTDSGDGHQEVLVEHIALGDAFPRLMQCFVPY